MSHNIWHDDASNCDAMFVVGNRKAAWHELGQRTDNAVRWEDAMQLAHLDWTVDKRPLYARNPLGKVVEVPSYGVFRQSDGAYLGTVGEQYTLIQNKFAFDFVDTLLESTNGAHYESAGALGNGERIWTLARIPHDINVLGVDKSECYLLFTTSHDGSMSAQCKLSTVRVVCQNTLNQALSASGSMIRVKHTKDAIQRLKAAQRIMSGVAQNVKTLEEKLNLLASRKLSRESMARILDRLFPKSQVETANQTRRENMLADVLQLFESNDKNAIPVIRGTAYNMLNAVTEYTDHVRTARLTDARKGYTVEMARAENALVGTGDRLKSEALEIILEETKDAPAMSQTLYVAGADSAKPATAAASYDDVTISLGNAEILEMERLIRDDDAGKR